MASDPFYGPPPIINDVVDCWAQEGIRFYGDIHQANGMAYHVVLPNAELEFPTERSMSKHSFTYLAQKTVQDGGPAHAIRV